MCGEECGGRGDVTGVASEEEVVGLSGGGDGVVGFWVLERVSEESGRAGERQKVGTRPRGRVEAGENVDNPCLVVDADEDEDDDAFAEGTVPLCVVPERSGERQYVGMSEGDTALHGSSSYRSPSISWFVRSITVRDPIGRDADAILTPMLVSVPMVASSLSLCP